METELEALVRFLVSKRWPFRLHATYGESIERELAVFERVNKEIPFNGLRWFIDHAETVAERDIARIKALGGGIAIQHRMAFQGEYFMQRYGPLVAETAPPIALMRERGVPLGAGTDGTRVATYNPWVSLYWLVSGKTVGGTQMHRNRNTVSRLDALRLWTASNAWFCYDEGKKGVIAPGAYANLAVLSADFLSVPAEAIRSIESLLTIVDGKVAFAAEPSAALLPPVAAATQLAISPALSPVTRFGGYYIKDSTAWRGATAAVGEAQAAADAAAQSKGGKPAAAIVPAPEDLHAHRVTLYTGHDC